MNRKNFYLDNLYRNINRVEKGLPMLHPKKSVAAETPKRTLRNTVVYDGSKAEHKPAIKNKGVININFDPLPDAPPPKIPGIDWDKLQKDNEPKKSSGLNYLMGVDDE